MMKPEAGGYRNWADLPWSLLSIIFEKIGTENILQSAQLVCREWWLLAHEPYLFRRIVILGNRQRRKSPVSQRHWLNIALAAVDRSAGCLVEFALFQKATDQLLERIAYRSTGLRILRLIKCLITDDVLVTACGRFPLLEELDISSTFVEPEFAITSIGRSCPNLKTFRLNVPNTYFSESNNRDALAISRNMRGLRELELMGNRLNNYGLRAILNRCTHLESLDIRGCVKANFGATLQNRYKGRLKILKTPKDSARRYRYDLDNWTFYVDVDYKYYATRSTL